MANFVYNFAIFCIFYNNFGYVKCVQDIAINGGIHPGGHGPWHQPSSSRPSPPVNPSREEDSENNILFFAITIMLFILLLAAICFFGRSREMSEIEEESAGLVPAYPNSDIRPNHNHNSYPHSNPHFGYTYDPPLINTEYSAPSTNNRKPPTPPPPYSLH